MADRIKDPNNLFHYLMTTHAPLIHRSIKSLRKKNKLPSEDVMEDSDFHYPGMVGLMEAIHKYNPNSGDFLPYAEASIRARIQSHADSAHEVPKHIRMKAKRFAKLYESSPTEQAPSQPAASSAPLSTQKAVSPPEEGGKIVDKSMIPEHLHDIYDQVFKKK